MSLPSHDNITSPTSRFFSRPDIQSPILDVKIHEHGLINDGYIFLAPFNAAQSGPYIYDNNGSLVWSGFGVAGPANSHNFHVCSFRGADHLCFHAGNQARSYSKGHGVVMDNQYRIVSTVHAASMGLPSDMHEFRLPDGGETALITIFQPIQLDLSNYGLTSGLGWILDSIFQEVNVSSNELLFEWRSLDHILPEWSYDLLNISQDGLTPETAWDYFHINSVDKSRYGDYLISGRHTNCIYKISGESGSVVWELQGKHSTFELSGFNFSWQHDARWVSENDTTSVISLFDNARRTHQEVDTAYSSGKVITLNHITNFATLDMEIHSPITSTGRISTESQGNMQLLPNSNIFFGWGAEAQTSEHLPDGKPVWYATFGEEHNPNSYRAFKAQWHGNPYLTTPAIWAYGRTNSSCTAVYISWNGATEVESWNVYAGESSSGPFGLIALQTPKSGFETTVVLDQHHPWVFVEAIGKVGNAIRNSSLVKTFIPGDAILPFCGEMYCLGPPKAEIQEVGPVNNDLATSVGWWGIIGLSLIVVNLLVVRQRPWKRFLVWRTGQYMRVEDNQNDLTLRESGETE